MGDLARRFNLTSDLLLPVVTARLGSLIRGRLEGGLLFTPAYIARIKVLPRRLGPSKAVVRPTGLGNSQACLGFPVHT